MAKKIFVLFLACLAGLWQAKASDVFRVNNVVMEAGGEATIDIMSNFSDDYPAFAADIILPEGLTLKKNSDGTPVAELGFSTNAFAYSSTSGYPEEGHNKFAAMSNDFTSYLPLNGSLLKLKVLCSPSIASGTVLSCQFEGEVSDIHGNVTFDNKTFHVTVGTPTNDVVTVNNIEAMAGGTAEMVINLSTTATNYTGYQMSLYLPEGVTLQKDEDDDYLYTLSSRHNKNHVFSVNQQADGGLMLVCYSMTKKTIAAGDGELLRLPVNIASTATSSRQGSISGIVFSDTSGKTYQANNALVNFTISEPVAPPAQSLIGGTVPELVAYYHGVDNAPYVTDFIEVDQTVLASLATTNADWSFGTWTNDATNRDKIGAAGTSAGSESAWTVSSIAPYTVYFYDASKRLLNSNPGYFSSSNIGQVKYIKISVDCNNFRLYLDGETYRQSIKAVDVNTNYPIAELSVAVKKVMPGMPVTWEEFLAVNSPINNGVFNFYPIAPGNDYTALCSTNWTADTYGNYFATTGTTVGVNFNEVFNSRYIGANSFTYTPDDSYNIVASSGYKEQLGLPNTFKMYVGRAAWDNVDETWVDRVYSFGSTENNRYNLTKTTGWGDEFDLISHTLASSATQHTTKITYTYPSVSTRIENGRWVVADNYEVNDASYTYKTCFVDPFAKPVQSMLKKGSYMYSFSTQYGVAPNASGIELQYFKLTGQYDSEAPYTDNLKNMLANGIWKINGNVTIIGDNGIMYYNILNASTIATDGAVKIANKFSDESGRPSSTVTQTLTIPLVNILGGTYNFTFSFMMSSTGGSTPEKTEQTLSLNELPTMTVGDAAYTLPAKTTEGLTLTWSSSNTAVATVAGNVLTVVGAGTAIITATQAGNSTYKAFTRQFTLTVNEAAPSIDVTDVSTLNNTIYIEPVEAFSGNQLTLSVKMKNTVEAESFGFDLHLPDGVSVACDIDGFPLASLSTKRTTTSKTNHFNADFKQDGSLNIQAYSSRGYTISGNDGEVALITIDIADDLEPGDYPIVIRNIAIADNNSVTYRVESVTTALTIADYILGDANSDSFIDVGDLTAISHYILERPDATFNVKAADANTDNNIDVGDLTAVSHLILWGSVQRPSASRGMATQLLVPMKTSANGVTDISTLDNVVYAEPFTVAANSSYTMSVKMKNSVVAEGFGFDLVLPDGITVARDNDGFPLVSLSTERTNDKKTNNFNADFKLDGTLNVQAYSSNGNSISGNDGEVAKVVLNIAADVTPGTYPVFIRNISISDVNATSHRTEEVQTAVTVTEASAYDVVLDETSTTAPEAANGVDVLVKRTINAGEWSTICLPFTMTEAQCQAAFGDDVKLGDFTGYIYDDENDVITVSFSSATSIEANHPYIIRVSNKVTEFAVDDVDIDPEDEPTVATVKRTKKQWSEMIGTYVAATTIEAQMLFLSNNKFWYSAGNTKMKAFRAYFDFYDVLSEVEDAESRVTFTFDDATAISTSLRNLEQGNEKFYDLQGRRVKPVKKGLYIKDGKKVVIK